MTHGMVARNDNGVLLSADQKNYVFAGYYAAPAPSGNLYTFYVANTAMSIYGVRLPVGGQGAVISVVGSCVTVIGSSVQGLLVFSPITGGGRSGYGFSMFNAGGECTFDSNQKHLVVTAAGSLYQGGLVAGAGDVVIFSGCGVYPSYSTSTTTIQDPPLPAPAYRFTITYQNGGVAYQYGRMAADTIVTTWSVSRGVAVRTGAGVSWATLLQEMGRYAVVGPTRFYQSIVYGQYNPDPGPAKAVLKEVPRISINSPEAFGWLWNAEAWLPTNVGRITAANKYPYAASAYNTSQNLALITDSSLYL